MQNNAIFKINFAGALNTGKSILYQKGRKMQKTIVAVGGGEIGRIKILPDGTACQTEVETTLIDRFIVEASGKKHPKMLFVGTATGDKESYLEIIRKHFKDRLGCSSVEPLNLVDSKMSATEIRDKIFSSDIVYVGGGDTTFMLKIWRQYGVDKILYEAYQSGIVLSGISAGAICWFEYYDNMDDIDDIEQLELVKGLSFVKGFGVPHYDWLTDDEKNRINDKLKEKNIRGWSMDDCTALVFQDDKVKSITCRSDRKVSQIP